MDTQFEEFKARFIRKLKNARLETRTEIQIQKNQYNKVWLPLVRVEPHITNVFGHYKGQFKVTYKDTDGREVTQVFAGIRTR